MRTILHLNAGLNKGLKISLATFLLITMGWQNQIFAQSCPVSNEITITVVPQPTISITGAITICAGGDATLTAAKSGGVPGTCAIQWESSADGNSGWTPIAGASGDTYKATNVTVTTYYHAVYSCTEITCNKVISNSQAVTVVPVVAIVTDPQSFDECLSGNQTLTVKTSGGTGANTLTYQWESSSDNSTWNSIAGAIADTYTPISTGVGTTYYRVRVSSAVSGCGSVTSKVATVNITPQLAISAQTNALDECKGGADKIFASYTGGAGKKTFQWFVSPDNSSAASYTAIPGQTDSTYTPNSTISGVNWYKLVVTASGKGCTTAESKPIKVTITDVLALSNTLSDFDECLNGDQKLTITITGGAASGTTYQWVQSSNLGGPFVNADGPNTNPIYQPVSTAVGTKYYKVLVTSSVTSCGSKESNVAKVTVTPQLQITAAPQPIVECVGGTDILRVKTTGGAGKITYQWFSGDNSGNVTTTINGANDSTYQPLATTAVTKYYRVEIYAAGTGCNLVSSTPVSVTVNPVLAITNTLNDFEECTGGNQSLTVNVTGSTASQITYQWQVSITNDGSGFTNINNAVGATYTPDNTNPGVKYYRVLVSSSGSGCGNQIPSNIVKVTINAQLAGKDLQPIIECTNGNKALTVVTTGGSADPNKLTYIWKVSNSASGPFTAITTSARETYIPNSATDGILYYTVTVSSPGNNCAPFTSVAAKVEVKKQLVITADISDFTECKNGKQPLQVVVINGTGNYKYQWYKSINSAGPFSPITGETSSTFIPDATAAPTVTYYYVQISDDATCDPVKSATVKVTVNDQLAIVTQPNDINECTTGGNLLNVAVNNGAGVITYTWQSSKTISGGYTTVANNDPTKNTYKPDDSTPGTTYYRVIVKASGTGCDSIASNPATVIVSPQISITTQPVGFDECIGGQTQLSIIAGGGSGDLKYQWQINTDISNTAGWSDINGQIAATFKPSSASAGITYYRVVVTAPNNGCSAPTPVPVKVQIFEKPKLVSTATVTAVCVGGGVEMNTTLTGGVGCTIQWQSFDGTNKWNDIPSETKTKFITPALTKDSKYRSTVVCSGDGCCN